MTDEERARVVAIAAELSVVESGSDDEVDEVAASETRRALLRAVLQRLPAVTGLLVVVVVVARVIAVGDGNVSTALAIVGAAGAIPVVTGVVLQVLPIYSGFLSWVVTFTATHDRFRAFYAYLWCIYILVLLPLSYLVPWTMTVTILFSLVLFSPHAVRKRLGLTRLVRRMTRVRLNRQLPKLIEQTAQSEPVGDSLDAQEASRERALMVWVPTILKEAPRDTVMRQHWRKIFMNWHRLQASCSNTEKDEYLSRISSDKDAYEARRETIAGLPRMQSRALTVYLVTALIIFVTGGIAADTPWVPATDLNIKNGGRITGYVVQRDSDWTTLLTLRGHFVKQIRTQDVAAMQVCVIPGYRPLPTVWQLVRGRGRNYPNCSSAD